MSFRRAACGLRDGNQKQTCLVRSAGAQGQFKDVMWKDVCVGDLVKLHDRDWIPADVCLFTSSAEDGAAFIDTMDLDGEVRRRRKTKKAHI